MKEADFNALPVDEDLIRGEVDAQKSLKLHLGDCFLSSRMAELQRGQKIVGQEISYYKVIDIRPNGNVVYGVELDILEEN